MISKGIIPTEFHHFYEILLKIENIAFILHIDNELLNVRYTLCLK